MTKLEDAIADAKTAEAIAREQLQGWRAKAAKYDADAERLSEQLGEVALTNFDAVPGLQSQIAAALAGASAADAATKAAERALRVAKDRVPLAQAEVLREEAAGLWEKAAGHQATTDRLLAELEAHEGVTYLPVMIGNIGQALLLPTAGGALVEQAKAKDAEASRLQASVSVARA